MAVAAVAAPPPKQTNHTNDLSEYVPVRRLLGTRARSLFSQRKKTLLYISVSRRITRRDVLQKVNLQVLFSDNNETKCPSENYRIRLCSRLNVARVENKNKDGAVIDQSSNRHFCTPFLHLKVY